MIATLRGTVVTMRLDRVVLEVAGIGYLVHATPSTVSALRIGESARLSTSLVVREDSLTLFGFGDDEERDVFEILQTVSGVGPRLALAMLAVHTPDSLRQAVAGEDLAALQRVPGIGKKSAQRLVLELGDRLGPVQGDALAPAAGVPAHAGHDAVVDALIGLGWSSKVAVEAVAAVTEEEAEPVGRDDVAPVLRAALQHLGGHRG